MTYSIVVMMKCLRIRGDDSCESRRMIHYVIHDRTCSFELKGACFCRVVCFLICWMNNIDIFSDNKCFLK